MFQKSKHIPEDSYFRFLEGAGASDVNGTTDLDRTNYYETVPSNQLELALWLESDRMGYLLDDLTEASFQNQQDVVRNERRQKLRESALRHLSKKPSRTRCIPKTIPTTPPSLVRMRTFRQRNCKDVKSFFKQYYVPNNASLAIVGDINKTETLALVEKYFGGLKRGPDVPPVTVTTPPITEERRHGRQGSYRVAASLHGMDWSADLHRRRCHRRHSLEHSWRRQSQPALQEPRLREADRAGCCRVQQLLCAGFCFHHSGHRSAQPHARGDREGN